MSLLPGGPWQEVSVYFKQLTGEGYLLVTYDDYSRYLVVEVVPSVAASIVVPRLRKVFAEFEVPDVVHLENGPPFNGKDLSKFASVLGFKHRTVTPLWPRANGQEERFMRTLKNAIEATKASGRPWKGELCELLRNYRVTPHASTGKPPAPVMFNRRLRVKLPEAPLSSKDPASLLRQDSLALDQDLI